MNCLYYSQQLISGFLPIELETMYQNKIFSQNIHIIYDFANMVYVCEENTVTQGIIIVYSSTKSDS